MKRLNILWIGLISVLMTACYDDYEKDYDKSSVYFASQKPLRTLVADTDMSIKVGVAIGGKREVHTDDWATFEIDPSLLEGTGLTLMPENYYQLANPNKMTISNPKLAIADVKVTFSDAFYEDNTASVSYTHLTNHAYLRLKNLEVNYQIPKRWLQPLRLTKLQVYVNGTNLLTFSKGDSRRDPEHSGQNVYPVVRRYNIGFRLGL